MTRALGLAVALAFVLGVLDARGEGLIPIRASADGSWPVGPGTQAPPREAACGDDDIVPPVNGQPFQWKAGLEVGVWVDRNGSAGAAYRNPKPMFTFSERDTRSIFEGINQWGDIRETGVTFVPVTDNAAFSAHYWFTVAWPVADVTFHASDGVRKTLTCRVPPASLASAAYTCSFQDQVRGVSQSHTIAGAITLVNTAHSYVNPKDGHSYDTWAYRVLDWPLALTKLGAHENGHLMGLADLPSRDADGLERPHVMKPFNGTNDTAPFGGLPRLRSVTACDRATILSHPSRQYERWICSGPGAVPPPPCKGAAPVCRDPKADYPAPVWECEG